ncbi:MAG: DUF6353 family protein [Ruminococcus sp.]|nr:DUF6353 family protein [Ruminococcus sp.]MCM1391778.1 DUF6353 family protein [Ruminococcus sp.]
MKGSSKVQQFGRKALVKFKRGSPLLLTCMSAVGVVAVAVTASKATLKADDLFKKSVKEKGDELTATEKMKIIFPVYLPTVVIGASTVACIFGTNALSKKQQASLASAYALLDNSYKKYKLKLKELYGEEAHQNIVDSIAKSECKEVPIYAQTMCGNAYLLPPEEDDEEKRLFYDIFSDRYFESTFGRVIAAEYHLNRNFMFFGCESLNDFYEFLGLDPVDGGDDIGWSTYSGEIYWIDFDHQKVVYDDGLECYTIEMVFNPTSEFLDDL